MHDVCIWVLWKWQFNSKTHFKNELFYSQTQILLNYPRQITRSLISKSDVTCSVCCSLLKGGSGQSMDYFLHQQMQTRRPIERTSRTRLTPSATKIKTKQNYSQLFLSFPLFPAILFYLLIFSFLLFKIQVLSLMK